nr:MAG TPA: hypothetical protein [Caudoviricetes sp.]
MKKIENIFEIAHKMCYNDRVENKKMGAELPRLPIIKVRLHLPTRGLCLL